MKSRLLAAAGIAAAVLGVQIAKAAPAVVRVPR
jgi:hypothetical protein